ncbi:MAG: 30S ribosomal protein S18 [Dehalococcoidia bacterium]|nr:MAG: 30S ribosomal protein S18 [Dehalococcoidia bacterium]
MAGFKSGKAKTKTWSKPRYVSKRKFCSFCSNHIKVIDYKDPTKLNQYISGRSKIEPRRRTGTCAKHQRTLALAIKRARHLALLPYAPAHIRTTGGMPTHESPAS